jgi:hypothetical protein
MPSLKSSLVTPTSPAADVNLRMATVLQTTLLQKFTKIEMDILRIYYNCCTENNYNAIEMYFY